MFKNCCGCKTPTEKKQIGEKEKDAEIYSKSSSKADGNPKVVSPSKVAPKQDAGNVSSAPPKPPAEPEKAKSPAAPAAPVVAVAPARKLSTQGPGVPVAPALPSTLEPPATDAAKSNDEETVTKESTPSKSGSVAATTAAASGAEDLSANGDGSKPASPDPDSCDAETAAATLRAFAHGMLHTPHPSKRSGSVPGLGSLPQWLSQEDDDDDVFREGGGTTEPPATPVGRDELALRRHRFFSDLLQAHQAATEHRVRFDPLGPIVAGGFEHEQRTPTVEFETLLNRLEKVTTRLERTVSATEEALQKQAGLQNSHEQIVTTGGSTLKEIESKVDSAEIESVETENIDKEVPIVLQDPPKSNQEKHCIQSTNSDSNMSVAAFQDILNGPLASFLTTSAQIGDDVAAIAQLVKQAFQAQTQYLSLAASSGAPSMDQNMKLLEPTSTQIRAIQEFREKHRGSQQFNHLSAVSESIAALGWVTVSPAPAPYVKEMNDAGQFYTNRVLKEWKEKDKKHKVWVDAWVETLHELQKFVKQYHTTGLVWGGKGSPPSAPAGVPPPPPPGLPPPPPEMPIGDIPPGSEQDRSALFAEINRGEAITSTLKKVTPDMQTHKNPTLRSGPAPFKAPVHTSTYRSVTAPGQVVDKPATFTKEGKKWLVEYHKGNQSLVIDQTEMNNVIYMYKCVESTLTVKGKVNSVVLDSCRKSSVVFDSVVSSVEFVNCQSVQMQVINKVPTISIDKTDGCQMYLSPESLDVEIVSAKSSEMNVMVPKPNGDYSEYPVPEQFKTTLSPKGLLTIAVESKG